MISNDEVDDYIKSEEENPFMVKVSGPLTHGAYLQSNDNRLGYCYFSKYFWLAVCHCVIFLMLIALGVWIYNNSHSNSEEIIIPTEELNNSTMETTVINTVKPVFSTVTSRIPMQTSSVVPFTSTTVDHSTVPPKAISQPSPIAALNRKSYNNSFCPDDYIYLDHFGACYKMHQTPAIFVKAEQKCQSEGAHLVSIHSEEENTFVVGMYQMGQTSEIIRDIWIGLHNDNPLGNWEWTDRTNVDFILWKSGFPVVQKMSTYIYLNPMDYQWKKTQRYQKLFICKKTIHSITGNPQIDPKIACENGFSWFQQTGQCYKVMTSEMSFENATEQCRSENSQIASVSSVQENMFLIGLAVRDAKAKRIWIGINENLNSWNDGSAMEYSNWGHGEPADHNQRVTIEVKGGSWRTHKGEAVAICKKF